MADSRRRLLVVSHACVTPVNQLLFVSLEQQMPDLAITLLIPSNWRNDYTGKAWQVQRHPDFKGEIVTLPVVFPWHISLHFYWHGVGRLIRQVKPHWIYLDEEPWALVTQQVARINRRIHGAPILFHTNQNLNKRYPWPFRAFEQWVYREAAHALPVGEEAAGVLQAKGYANPLTVFPYGIDETLYTPHPADRAALRTAHDARDDTVVFGYLGRFVPEKGLDVALAAFAQVYGQWPAAQLWLVGDGPEKPALVESIQKLGLPPVAVKLVPSIPHEQAPAMLSAFDVLLLPSLTRRFWKEQFGRVIIEAMACGTPVIGSDSGEIPHLIAKLGGGVSVPEGDASALAEAMLRLGQDAGLRQTMVATGQARVAQGYTNTQLARGFANILISLQSKQQPPEGIP